MPYPNRFSFKQWKECRRCGFHWPKDELSRDSFGNDVCPECYDKDGVNEERARLSPRGEELSDDYDV